MRCIADSFDSTFEPLTPVSATVLALCEPSNPSHICTSNSTKFIEIIRRSHSNVQDSQRIMKDDTASLNYFLREVQHVLYAISSRLDLQSFGFSKLDEELNDLPAPSNEYHPIDLETLRSTVVFAVRHFN